MTDGGYVTPNGCTVGAFGSENCRVLEIEFQSDRVIFTIEEEAFGDPGQPLAVTWHCHLSRKLLKQNYGQKLLEYSFGSPVRNHFACASPGSSDYPPEIEI